MQRCLAIAFAAGLSALAGCAAMTGPEMPLEGTWVVEDVNRGGIIDFSRIEITFTPDGATGSTGCNRFNGSYESNGNSIAFGPLATTRRACAPALNMQERRVLDALGAVTTYSYDDTGALILEGPPPHRLLARRADGA